MQYLRLDNVLENVDSSEEIRFERLRFSGGENHIKIISCDIVGPVTIEAQLKNSDYVMELFLATDALRRVGVEEISLLCPYIPYARQDRVMVSGEPLSIKVFTQLLNIQNYKVIYTLDNHSPVAAALIDRCVEIGRDRILHRLIDVKTNSFVISPDAGAYKKAVQIGRQFGMDVIQASKIRDVNTGEITETRVDTEELGGRDCYIIDDICDGGRTYIELAKVLRRKDCGNITLYVSHGIFSYGVDSLYKHGISKILTTNCFRRETEIVNWNLEIIPLRKEDLK